MIQYYGELVRIRKIAEVVLEDFPRRKCSHLARFVKKVLGIEEAAGEHLVGAWHAWNYDAERGVHIDLTMDLKDIWKRFEGRCRTAIRNAERYEPKICADNRENGVHDFYGIYRENATRKSFVNTRSKEYFKKLVYRFGEDNLIDLWSVEIKNEKVAAALVGKFKKKVSLLYLASTVKGLKYNINNLLIWKLIQRYQGEFSSFNMGSLGHSIYGSVSGYGKFKLGFNPKVIYSPQFVKYNKNWFFNLLKSEQSKIFLKFKNIFIGASNNS